MMAIIIIIIPIYCDGHWTSVGLNVLLKSSKLHLWSLIQTFVSKSPPASTNQEGI